MKNSIPELSGYGNRKRHHNPLEKKYRFIKLLCMGQKKREKLLKVVNSKKRVYRKRKRKEI